MARPRDFDEDEALTKAVELFWLKGYNGTSMQDLLDTLGLSRSSLYRTYTDKHTLFMKALANYQKFSSAEIRGVVNDTDTAQETIRKLLEFTTDKMLSDKQQKGCFMVNSEVEVGLHDKEVLDIVLFNDKELEDTLFKVLKKGQEIGEINNRKDARAFARLYLSILKGIRVTAKSVSDRTVFTDIIETALTNLD